MIKGILILVVENKVSERRTGAIDSDMPLQLEFDYRFSGQINQGKLEKAVLYTIFILY